MRHRARSIDTSTTTELRRQLDRLIFAALVMLTLTRNSPCQDAVIRQHEVVPSAWITVAKNPKSVTPGNPDSSRAFVFPSLDRGQLSAELKAVTIGPVFLAGKDHFHHRHFVWTPHELPQATVDLELTRNGTGLTVGIDQPSMTNIRMLRWDQYHHLQRAFTKWLLDHNGCWIFEDCANRFDPKFFDTLSGLWKDTVLADATFARFAGNSLNDSARRNFEVTYAPDSGKGIPALTNAGIKMRATEIGTGEVLSITWGATTIYPAKTTGVTAGNVRPTMGGMSELQIHEWDGLHLFPPNTTAMTPVPEDPNASATNNSLPFRAEWASLMSGSQPVFLPMNGLLDLHDARLLMSRSPGNAAAHLFLLTPEWYIKPDAGPGPNGIAQYTTDARGKEVSKADAVAQLTRRYLLIGCKDSGQACARNELMGLLDQAYGLTTGLAGDPGDPGVPAMPAYTTGVFTNDSAVELRHHVRLNGHREETAPAGETWGALVAPWMLSSMNHSSNPRSHALLEVHRTVRTGDSTEIRKLLFYTTNYTVLNKAQVFEGDEFYGGPDVSALPR